MNLQLDFLQILEKSIKLDTAPEGALIKEIDICPVCGDEITRNGRCKTCYTCGWSSCDL